MATPNRGAIVVTGSSTGIGRACALRLDRGGFTVFAGVRRAEDGEALRGEASQRLQPLILDVADPETIAAAADQVRAATGGRLAGLVNNAGIAVAGPVEAVPLDDLRRQLEINVIGQVAVTQAFLAMIRPARGRVVFMSSIGGRNAVPFLSPYSASKHAIEAIGDSLRQEMRPFGVEVSIVEPGAVATPIWEKSGTEARAARQQMEPEIERVYGERLGKMQALAAKAGAAGVEPDEVAQAVEHALTAARPRTRYVIGREAKIQGKLGVALPSRTMDRLVAREIDRA